MKCCKPTSFNRPWIHCRNWRCFSLGIPPTRWPEAQFHNLLRTQELHESLCSIPCIFLNGMCQNQMLQPNHLCHLETCMHHCPASLRWWFFTSFGNVALFLKQQLNHDSCYFVYMYLITQRRWLARCLHDPYHKEILCSYTLLNKQHDIRKFYRSFCCNQIIFSISKPLCITAQHLLHGSFLSLLSR